MQRLIAKYAAYDISKLISDEEAFCNYINNHLSYISNEDFNKCISKKHEFITFAFLNLSNKAFDKLASATAKWLLKNDKLVYNKILNTYKIPANNFLKVFTQLKLDIISYIRRSVSNSKSIYKGINSYINNMFHKTDDESTEKIISNITDLKEYLRDKRNIDLDDLLEDIIREAPLNFICYTDEQIEAICHSINKSFVKYYPKGIISRDDLSQFLRERAISIESFYFRYFNENDLPIIKELIRDIHEYDNNVKIDYNKRLDEDLRIYISKFSYLIHEIFINNSKEILDNKSFLDQIGVKQIVKKSYEYDDKDIQNLTIEQICENKNIEYTQQQFNNSIKNVSSNYQYYLGLNDSQQRFRELPEYLFRSIAKYINNVKSIDELMNAIKSKISADDLFKIRQSFINDMNGISDPAVKQIVTDILLSIFPKGNCTLYRNTNLMKSVANILYKNTQFLNCGFIGLEKTMPYLSDLITKLFIRTNNTIKDKIKGIRTNNITKDKIKEYSNKEIKTNQKEKIKPVDKSQINFKSKQNNNNDNSLRNMSFQQVKKLPTLPSLNRKNDNIGDKENISLANYYQTKIIISSDGNIKYLPPNNNNQYINELTNKNLNYAIGTITDNGIVCIHQNNNMNINDIINICRNDSQINKIYELNEQINLAATITRRAKLAKLIWKK